MPDYHPPRELTDETRIEVGTVEPHWMMSQSLHDRRTFWVCLPPHFNPRTQYPVAYFNDGEGYLHFCDLPYIASYLIDAGLVKPFIAVLIKPNDREKEYALNNHYVRFLANELVPWIDDNYPTLALASSRAIIGASAGALSAAHAARRRPNVFGLVAGQSGNYTFQNDALLHDYQAAQNLGIKFHLIVGEYETDLQEEEQPRLDLVAGQRRFVDVLRLKGYAVSASEYPEGHQWKFWQAHIGDAQRFFWGK